MTVALDAPAGTATEIATAVARLDDVTYSGLDAAGRDRYDAIARLFLDLIADDGYHWGCTSAEGAEEYANESYDRGFADGFDKAKERVIDGLARLQNASMVEAEAVVVIVPKIRAMSSGGEPRVPDGSPPVTSSSEQA